MKTHSVQSQEMRLHKFSKIKVFVSTKKVSASERGSGADEIFSFLSKSCFDPFVLLNYPNNFIKNRLTWIFDAVCQDSIILNQCRVIQLLIHWTTEIWLFKCVLTPLKNKEMGKYMIYNTFWAVKLPRLWWAQPNSQDYKAASPRKKIRTSDWDSQ